MPLDLSAAMSPLFIPLKKKLMIFLKHLWKKDCLFVQKNNFRILLLKIYNYTQQVPSFDLLYSDVGRGVSEGCFTAIIATGQRKYKSKISFLSLKLDLHLHAACWSFYHITIFIFFSLTLHTLWFLHPSLVVWKENCEDLIVVVLDFRLFKDYLKSTFSCCCCCSNNQLFSLKAENKKLFTASMKKHIINLCNFFLSKEYYFFSKEKTNAMPFGKTNFFKNILR